MRWRSAELLELATGAAPSAAPFAAYLQRKYGAIYGF
jgi:Zn-dependent M32 family carboxypeptidase